MNLPKSVASPPSPPPAPPAGPASLGSTARFWDGMLLNAPRAVPDDLPVAPGLAPVLRLFEAGSAGSAGGGLSVPTAGALHPYEHLAVVPGPDGPSLYAMDTADRLCRLLFTGPQLRRSLVQAGLPTDPADHAVVVLTLLRPWLSMRKYGDRRRRHGLRQTSTPRERSDRSLPGLRPARARGLPNPDFPILTSPY